MFENSSSHSSTLINATEIVSTTRHGFVAPVYNFVLSTDTIQTHDKPGKIGSILRKN
jgi:hypothetical protein